MRTSWSRIEAEAPELAAAVRARFAANRHHVIATIRPSGTPRLSGTEVTFEDEVGVGMMPGSHKLADVWRDPRVEIHSAPLEPDLREGDAKLGGRLLERGAPAGIPGHLFVLDIERVALVRVVGDELVFTIWDPVFGGKVMRRR